jgi:hypothetical protein
VIQVRCRERKPPGRSFQRYRVKRERVAGVEALGQDVVGALKKTYRMTILSEKVEGRGTVYRLKV